MVARLVPKYPVKMTPSFWRMPESIYQKCSEHQDCASIRNGYRLEACRHDADGSYCRHSGDGQNPSIGGVVSIRIASVLEVDTG